MEQLPQEDLYTKLVDSYDNNKPLYNKLRSDISKRPYHYPKNTLYFIAIKEEKLRKRLLDILCFRITSPEEANEFIKYLIIDELYDWYITSIIEGKNLALKIHYVLYINYSSLSRMFSSPLDLARSIVKCKALDNMYGTKGDALLQLSRLTQDQKTLMYIKANLIQVVLSERNKLASITTEYQDITGKVESEEEQVARKNRTEQVLSYYKKQFEVNTGISMK